MLDILKELLISGAISAGILTMTIFFIKLPIYESSMLNLSPFNNNMIKTYAIMVISMIVFVYIYMGALDGINSNTFMKITGCGAVVLFICNNILFHIIGKIKKNIQSNNDHYNSKEAVNISIIAMIVILCLFSSFLYMDFKKLHVYDTVIKANQKEDYIGLFTIIFQTLFYYIINLMFVGQLLTILNFNSLQKIIFQLGNEEVTAFVIFESDEKILIKSDKSYPKVIDKCEVKSYQIVYDSSTNSNNRNNLLERIKNLFV